jgi:hypothetical protein
LRCDMTELPLLCFLGVQVYASIADRLRQDFLLA